MRIGKRKLNKWDGILLLLGLALCFAAELACGPRDDGSEMICRDAGQAVVWLGGALAALALLHLPARGRVRLALDALIAALAAAAAILPGNLLPLCMMRTMRCHFLLRPAVVLVSVAIIALAGWDALKTLRARR